MPLLRQSPFFGMGISAASAVELRLSHQWSVGDVRHKVAEMIATDVAAAGVDLDIRDFSVRIVVESARAVQPFVARSGGHDRLSAVISGGQRGEYNLTLMPGMVRTTTMRRG